MAVKNKWYRRLAPAAAICVIIAGLIAAWLFAATKPPTVISQYGGHSNASYCYAAPYPGEYYCFLNVDAARSAYAGEDVVFLLAPDIFASSGSALTEEEKAAEYQRLIDLGYQLYQTTHIAYIENGEAISQPVVVGLFTEEQLADFDANSAYGYTFRFVSNADGSDFSVCEDELITSYKTNFAG